MASILVVDDEQDVAWAVERGLSKRGHRVMAAYSGQRALELMRRQRPDLVILDIIMPGMDGIEVCERLRGDPTLAAVPILFLTAKGDVEDRIEGFKAGCDDYLSKPFDLRELCLRVEALLRRGGPATKEEPSGTLEVGPLILDLQRFVLRIEDEVVDLTPIEFDLLLLLMSHPAEVFSSERLLQEVWGYPAGTGDPATVRWHIMNLRAKIEPDPSEPTYIRTVLRYGYTLSPE
jgi:DNA-binding response OmpR family regulator